MSIYSCNQLKRFNFLNPCERYQEETGYQLCNSLIAFKNGGLFFLDEIDASKEELMPLSEIETGEAKEIDDVVKLLKTSAKKCIKAVVYAVRGSEEQVVVCFIRGDKEVSEPKLKRICKKDIVNF